MVTRTDKETKDELLKCEDDDKQIEQKVSNLRDRVIALVQPAKNKTFNLSKSLSSLKSLQTKISGCNAKPTQDKEVILENQSAAGSSSSKEDEVWHCVH